MAPEVYVGQSYGPSVDIYSVGLVLYKLMNNNRLPFLPPISQPIKFSDREESLKRRISGERFPKPELASENFAAIILKACAYESSDRYGSAEDMLRALQGLEDISNEKCFLQDDDNTMRLDYSYDTVRLEQEEKTSQNIPKKCRKFVRLVGVGILLSMLISLGIYFLKDVSRDRFSFDDMERIYVYSEQYYGVRVFQEAAQKYHMELEEASEAEYKELKLDFEDSSQIFQGLEAFETTRKSNDKFIEYGPCAMYQTENGDAHLFQLLLYESGYKMIECGFDSELSFNFLNFYIVKNLSAKDEISVTFEADFYQLQEMK